MELDVSQESAFEFCKFNLHSTWLLQINNYSSFFHHQKCQPYARNQFIFFSVVCKSHFPDGYYYWNFSSIRSLFSRSIVVARTVIDYFAWITLHTHNQFIWKIFIRKLLIEVWLCVFAYCLFWIYHSQLPNGFKMKMNIERLPSTSKCICRLRIVGIFFAGVCVALSCYA